METAEKPKNRAAVPVDIPFEEVSEEQPNLFEQLKSYVENRIELGRIELIEKSSLAISKAVSLIVATFLALFILVFLSVALALFLGELLGNSFSGFFAVAGIYFLLVVLVLVLRKNLIEKKLVNLQIKRFFKNPAVR